MPRKFSQVKKSTSPFPNRNTLVPAPSMRPQDRRPSQLTNPIKRPVQSKNRSNLDNSLICVLKVEVDESDEP